MLKFSVLICILFLSGCGVSKESSAVSNNTASVETSSNFTNPVVYWGYNDNLSPSTSYMFKFHRDSGRLYSNIYYMSTAKDMPSERVEFDVVITDKVVLDKINNLIDLNVTHSDMIDLFCMALSNMEEAIKDEIVQKETDENKEYWESLYGYKDLNNDKKVTGLEQLNSSLDIILDELVN